MRRQSALALKTFGGIAAALLLLTTGTPGRAQIAESAPPPVPFVFDGLDWTLDRGDTFDMTQFPYNVIDKNAAAFPAAKQQRRGYNDFNKAGNNPSRAVLHFAWPFTRDLGVQYNRPTEMVIDNPNPGDPNSGVRFSPRVDLPANTNVLPNKGPYDPNLKIPQSFWFPNVAAWTPPNFNVARYDPNDYRSPDAGFSLDGDPSQPFNLDYGFRLATHDDFAVNGTTPADADLNLLPNAPPAVYKAVNDRLLAAVAAGSPTAVWTSGQLGVGRYGIDIYSPGDGTVDNGNGRHIARPNTSRVLVRVSWRNTVNPNNNALNFNGINDVVNSRLFLINLRQHGWIHLSGGSLYLAGVPYDGDPANQIVVTLYSLTPDNIDPASANSQYAAAPVITADAVRFTALIYGDNKRPDTLPVNLTRKHPDPNFPADRTKDIVEFTISPRGRILGPVVGTNKITFPNQTALAKLQPMIFVPREENRAEVDLKNPPVRSHVDPTDGTTAESPDPTALTTIPVFYALDSRLGNVDVNGNTLLNSDTTTPRITSLQKVRWRFEGVPDEDLRILGNKDRPDYINNIFSNAGTISASPLLANVRCRDGVVRPILYYATTNSNGTLGHVYALDPYGLDSQIDLDPNNPVKAGTQRTRAYWVYPSYRPLTDAEFTAGLVPQEYHDPNYTGAVPGPYPAQGAWGPDQIDVKLTDGDLIASATNPGQTVVRGDTRPRYFGGVQSSPLVVDDPTAKANGPQLLVLGNMNGHVYAFDAGGRGDSAVDAVNLDDQTKTFAGTTQRMWTWPRFGADLYHISGAAGANPYRDEAVDKNGLPLRVAFPSSPAFDPESGANSPILIGSGDGHLYALNLTRDVLAGAINGAPQFPQRVRWVYPDPKISLGPSPSTAAIFQPRNQPNNANAKYVYFTCGGRVFSIPLNAPAGAVVDPQSGLTVNGLYWVYPFTDRVPDPNVNDANSYAFDPGFDGTAPVVVSGMMLTPTDPTTPDSVYLTINGDNADTQYKIIALKAVATQPASQQTTLIAIGDTGGGNTRCTPIGTLLTGQDGLVNDSAGPVPGIPNPPVNLPALFFADDDGYVYGMGALPITDNTDPTNPITQLPILLGFADSNYPRSATASLVGGDTFNNFDGAPSHALLIEGDEYGQLRAYGVDGGADGKGDGTGNGFGGSGEPGRRPVNGSANGPVSIDVRTADYYDEITFKGMMQANANPLWTPLHNTNGAKLSRTADPKLGNLVNGNRAIGVDWGNKLFVAAAGVYHAQTPDATQQFYGATAPTVTVTFTFGQQGGPSRTSSVTVPAIRVVQPGNQNWPDDAAVTPGEHNGLTIFGIDENSGNANPVLLTGPPDNVYPWVAKVQLPILPDAASPFSPGSSAYLVSVQAHITQNIVNAGVGSQSYEAYSSRLQIGQNDYKGLSAGPYAASPNRFSLRGRRRRTFVTNPLALSVRGDFGGSIAGTTGPNQNNVIGWGDDITNVFNNGGDVKEFLGNGDRIVNPVGGGNNILGGSIVRALYAPVGMVQDGSSQTYYGLDNTRNQVPALYAMDRSALLSVGSRLQVQALPSPVRWHGTANSVMNPLPWEKLPTDSEDSADYPNLGTNALSVKTDKGDDLIARPVQLNPPTINSNDADPIQNRKVVPTRLDFMVSVPRYQPANVNRGVISTYSYGGVNYQNFGAVYTDSSGTIRGANALNANGDAIVGPMKTTDGLPVSLNDRLAFPAAGYVSAMALRAITPAQNGRQPFVAARIYRDAKNQNSVTGVQEPYRYFELGMTVPPTIKMRVAEQTLDLGKLPHGTGYTDVDNATNFYRAPFEPSGLRDYNRKDANGNLIASPWDDFFRPFTLINESNVNLSDLRIAKLIGSPNAPINANSLTNTANGNNAAAASRLVSDQVDSLSGQPLFGVPFGGPGLGNIGIVSSFDHVSTNSANISERSLWPILNPYVIGADVTNVNAVTPFLDWGQNLGTKPPKWTDGSQPQPTLHKARAGDPSGTIATIPDVPYDANLALLNAANNTNFKPQPPKVGIAVPLGAPTGTYANPVYAYEDNQPIQWREWVTATSPANPPADTPRENSLGRAHDALLNLSSQSGAPTEIRADPSFTLKLAVREARLTEGVTYGTLSQIDLLADLQNNVAPGANLLPAAYLSPNANPASSAISLFWTTNRQPIPAKSPFVDKTTGLPRADAPFSLAYSQLPAPYANAPFARGDFSFARPGTGSLNNNANNYLGLLDAAWWTTPRYVPGYDINSGLPLGLEILFPSTQTEANAVAANFPAFGGIAPPYLPGDRNPLTVRYASPAIAQGNLVLAAPPVGGTSVDSFNSEAYLFWQGQIDKARAFGGVGSPTQQQTETRTIYAPLVNGVPDTSKTATFLNDPALTKLSPKPLLVKLQDNGTKLLYLFWHAGNQSQTSLYYNVNAVSGLNTNFTAQGWFQQTAADNTLVLTGDRKLPTPGALAWQSDPYPIYRRVNIKDQANGLITLADCVDLVYTGVLKNRQTVEVLLSRYRINRRPPQTKSDPPLGALLTVTTGANGAVTQTSDLPVRLPQVRQELLARNGSNNTFAARDASWAYSGDPQDTIQIDMVRNNTLVHLNALPGAPLRFQGGRLDQAAGLVYFDVVARDDAGAVVKNANGQPVFGGGQMVVDIRSGTVSFPNIPPGPQDAVLATYTPRIMRMNTSRDETNVVRATLNGPFANDLAYNRKPAITSSGNNTNPIAFLDRQANPRARLQFPVVVNSGQIQGLRPTVDRLWTIYRKSDLNGGLRSTLYYKAQRLMIRLPRPFKLDQNQQIANLNLIGLTHQVGPYEVDWVRGRIYFTEYDEDNIVAVSYTADDGSAQGLNSGNAIQYRIAWGDEISANSKPTGQNNSGYSDDTTPEVVVPSDSAVNEGQVTAFRDPFADKTWLFWTSTRAGTTDLYYETIAPPFYPTLANER